MNLDKWISGLCAETVKLDEAIAILDGLHRGRILGIRKKRNPFSPTARKPMALGRNKRRPPRKDAGCGYCGQIEPVLLSSYSKETQC
jgi:hypothetical protein